MSQIEINSARLWARIMEMAKIGATPAGGCNRQALTDTDLEGRNLFLSWATAAGCEIRVDEIGNMFARRTGADNDLPPVMVGSHLDTQPTGGKFDGILGVLGGLEVVETLNDNNITTDHPLEIVDWTNEEGSRFDLAMMGSAVWRKSMDLQHAYGCEDRDGRSVKSELERLGLIGEATTDRNYKASFELHIEQGPILEHEGKSIGIVTGVQNMCRHRVVLYGQAAHAGPTPMTMRKDPMRALGNILPALYEMTNEHDPAGRITFGIIDALPGSSNVVPSMVEFTVDIRHPDNTGYGQMLSALVEIVIEKAAEVSVGADVRKVWEAPGVVFAPECVEYIRAAVDKVGSDAMEIISGAGHDSCAVSEIVPTAMIFIPCEGGLSHNEEESILPGQAAEGVNVLLHSVLNAAKN